eukprot:6060504-Prymnesium_polylepis.1
MPRLPELYQRSPASSTSSHRALTAPSSDRPCLSLIEAPTAASRKPERCHGAPDESRGRIRSEQQPCRAGRRLRQLAHHLAALGQGRLHSVQRGVLGVVHHLLEVAAHLLAQGRRRLRRVRVRPHDVARLVHRGHCQRHAHQRHRPLHLRHLQREDHIACHLSDHAGLVAPLLRRRREVQPRAALASMNSRLVRLLHPPNLVVQRRLRNGVLVLAVCRLVLRRLQRALLLVDPLQPCRVACLQRAQEVEEELLRHLHVDRLLLPPRQGGRRPHQRPHRVLEGVREPVLGHRNVLDLPGLFRGGTPF